MESQTNLHDISVLVVGDQYECRGEIEHLLQHTRWRVAAVATVGEAQGILRREAIEVVLCQHTLSDGTWVDVLDIAERREPPATVIVLAKPDDCTWAGVLTRGGYDLLPVPCVASELYAIVAEAWRHCTANRLPAKEAVTGQRPAEICGK
jgi:DNA-binding NtrC family response regulator